MTTRIRPRPDDIQGEFRIVVVTPKRRGAKGRHRDNAGPNFAKHSRVTRAEQKKQVLELRRQGLSWTAIGIRLGMRASRAWTLGDEAIRDIPRDSADAIRRVENERLDAIIHANWRNMELGDYQAGVLILKAQERRAKMLGLDQVSPEQAAAIDAVMFALVSRLPTMTLAEKEAEIRELTGLLDEPDADTGPNQPAADAGAGSEPAARSEPGLAPRHRSGASAG